MFKFPLRKDYFRIRYTQTLKPKLERIAAKQMRGIVENLRVGLRRKFPFHHFPEIYFRFLRITFCEVYAINGRQTTFISSIKTSGHLERLHATIIFFLNTESAYFLIHYIHTCTENSHSRRHIWS
jgi:hypothetical protein